MKKNSEYKFGLVKTCVCLAVLIFPNILIGQIYKTSNPDEIKFVTSDIANFWTMYDKLQQAKTKKESLKIFETEYLNKGSYGLNEYLKASHPNAESFCFAYQKYPKLLASLRRSTLGIEFYKKNIIRSAKKLKNIYPETFFPAYHFVMGKFESGGSRFENSLYIGEELTCLADDAPPEELGELIINAGFLRDIEDTAIHETIHYQPSNQNPTTNLEAALIEGGAEFATTNITGKFNLRKVAKLLTNNQMQGTETESFAEKNKPIDPNWFFAKNETVKERVASLGYLFGYEMCERFHSGAKDKKAALRTTIKMEKGNEIKRLYENKDDDKGLISEKWLIENKIPAVGIGFIKHGKLKEIRVLGEHKKGLSAPPNTIFNVASLTKPVTAMIALRLVGLGKWDLDEPLSNYWVDPDISNDARNKKITTRLVLSHQTGFANWRWLNRSMKLEFAFDPGTKYQYSGEGFEYLRRALEKKFNKTLDKLAEELIFKPLKMNDTDLVWSKKIDENRFAVGYDQNGKPYEIIKRKDANAADDLLTTIGDYGKFMIAVMDGKDLSKKVFSEMIRPQVKTKENKYFGLGWEIYDLGKENYALSHGGSDQGTQTLVFLLPKIKEGLLIFTNSDNGTNAYLPIIKEYLKKTGERIVEIEMK